MTPISRRKLLWLAVAAAAVCLILIRLLSSATPLPRAPDLRIAGQPQITNGTMPITYVLSNGTSRKLNIVDDSIGDPYVILEVDVGTNPPGIFGVAGTNPPGIFGVELTRLANSLKLNLAPGAALTNTLRLTNVPRRFQLIIEARDLASEQRRGLLNLLSSLVTLRWPTPHDLIVAHSSWIETGNSSNTTPNSASLGGTNSASP